MKKKIKDLKCGDISCENCPFLDNCSWVAIVHYTFAENLKIHIKEIEKYIKELEEKLEQEIEVDRNEKEDNKIN